VSFLDVNAFDFIRFEANSFYVMDRRYCDFKRLYKIHTLDAFYVTRAKDNMGFRRVYSKPKDTSSGIVYDQIIMLTNFQCSKRLSRENKKNKIQGPRDWKGICILNQ